MSNFLKKHKKAQAMVEFALCGPLLIMFLLGAIDLFHYLLVELDATYVLKSNVAKAVSYSMERCPAEWAGDAAKMLNGEASEDGRKMVSLFKYQISGAEAIGGARTINQDSNVGKVYWNKGGISVSDNNDRLIPGYKLQTATSQVGGTQQYVQKNKLGEEICFAVDIPIELMTPKLLGQKKYHILKSVCSLTESTRLAGCH